MSFRLRLTLVAAAAVGVAIVLASAVVYAIERNELRGPIDDSLSARAREVSNGPLGAIFGPGPFGAQRVYVQIVQANGRRLRPNDEPVPLPVDDRVIGVAKGTHGAFFTEMTVAHAHLRVYAFQYTTGIAVQMARPLAEVDHALSRIRLFLFLIAGGGVAVAALAGLLVTRAATAPVRRLTEATERVTETRDLSERIDARGRDELSRLAGSFNTMLAALEESTRAQRQLIADASHELRTPLTSLRTNIEVLASENVLAPDERERLLSDVVEQLGEMTTLIAELIEVAREEQHPTEAEDVRLDVIAARAVARSRRNRPHVTFTTDLEASTVHGVPATIERAVGNLLDNAGKWSSPGGKVEVSVRGPEVVVRDHGPGIDEDDVPYVFDRFYRAPSARGMPGSGLGLAIVRQVARAHGGDVVVERPEDGGTRMRLRLTA
jgi:two-component system, OmpR family, sensor histidine kinase MprB